MPSRSHFAIRLRPLAGDRFQPTGFPDIGPAEYERPRNGAWESCILVESVQSMANRLEAAAWDGLHDQPAVLLEGLPYVRVVDAQGRGLTSSRQEAHRLASAFLRDSIMPQSSKPPLSYVDYVRQCLGLEDDQRLSWTQIAAAVFKLDPLALIHGVFFSDARWPGQPKVPRALTAFVEAYNARPAVSGGVKRDEVRHRNEEGAGGAREGYGSVPFHRTEWVAESIVAHVVLDHDQLASYGLDDAARRLLEAIALWEVRALFDAGLRLRTACDLVAVDLATDAATLPERGELESTIRSLVPEATHEPEGAQPMTVVWQPQQARGRTSRVSDTSEEDGDS